MLRVVVGALLGALLLVGSAPTDTAKAAEHLWRLGWLDMNPPPSSPDGGVSLQAFRQGIRELGYVEGRDFVIDARFADTDQARVPRLAQELVDAGVDIIVTVGTPTTVAAHRTTTTIPIVMTGTEFPIENGLIASFRHPGGNVTGLTHNPDPSFAAKGLQLLKQAAPGANRVAMLGYTSTLDVGTAAPPDVPGLTVVYYNVADIKNLDGLHAILSKIHADRVDALFLTPAFLIGKYNTDIARFLTINKLPALTQSPTLIDAALLYYYTDFQALRRRAATYVDKIVKGEKPADLPVEQPSKFEFIVNLKTARALGLTMPASIMAFADRIIE